MTSEKLSTQSLLEQRGSVYGDPKINLKCAALLKQVYRDGEEESGNRNSGQEGFLAHDDAIEMCLTKIARIATGDFHQDNYDDLIGYATIAKKMAGFDA